MQEQSRKEKSRNQVTSTGLTKHGRLLVGEQLEDVPGPMGNKRRDAVALAGTVLGKHGGPLDYVRAEELE